MLLQLKDWFLRDQTTYDVLVCKIQRKSPGRQTHVDPWDRDLCTCSDAGPHRFLRASLVSNMG